MFKKDFVKKDFLKTTEELLLMIIKFKFSILVIYLLLAPVLASSFGSRSSRKSSFGSHFSFHARDLSRRGSYLWNAPTAYTAAKFEPGDFEEDNALEKAMAQDLYNGLKGNDSILSVETFLQWEDIKDVLGRGFIDADTMQIIFSEAGVHDGIMNFDQFFEVVDLVNQVSLALEESGGAPEEDDEEEEEMRLDRREFFGL